MGWVLCKYYSGEKKKLDFTIVCLKTTAQQRAALCGCICDRYGEEPKLHTKDKVTTKLSLTSVNIGDG